MQPEGVSRFMKRSNMRIVFFLGTLIICGSGIFIACSGGGEPPEKKPVNPTSVSIEKIYGFTSPESKDKFVMSFEGGDPVAAVIHFCIVAEKGDTLFQKKFPGTDLLQMGMDSVGAKGKSDYCLKNMKETMETTYDFKQKAFFVGFDNEKLKANAGVAFSLNLKNERIMLWWSSAENKLNTVIGTPIVAVP
jgi:hypothetical protein